MSSDVNDIMKNFASIKHVLQISPALVVFAAQDEFPSISSQSWTVELVTHSGTNDIVEVGNVTRFLRGRANELLERVLLEWLQ